MTEIVVVPGEKSLIKAFDAYNVEYAKEALLVGDVHIRDKQTQAPYYILERKAKGDLLASIKDGRYKEQKQRLKETGLKSTRIVYIIENLQKPTELKTQKMIWSAICNTQHRDNFSVFQTKSVDETVFYVTSLVKSIEKFGEGNPSISPENKSDDVASSMTPPDDIMDENKTEKSVSSTSIVNVNIKKGNVTQDDWFKYCLSLIPRCSLKISEEIVTKYPTITCLSRRINEAGPECLKDIKVGERKIGPKLSTDICSFVNKCYSHEI